MTSSSHSDPLAKAVSDFGAMAKAKLDNALGTDAVGKEFVAGAVSSKGNVVARVAHSKGQYDQLDPTKTIEGFWSLMKSKIVRVLQNFSANYLPLDIGNFVFYYYDRNTSDIVGSVVAAC